MHMSRLFLEKLTKGEGIMRDWTSKIHAPRFNIQMRYIFSSLNSDLNRRKRFLGYIVVYENSI